jgi:hypothetical protein
LFEVLPNADEMDGVIYRAYIKNGMLRKLTMSSTLMFLQKSFYREPLPEYCDYACWISKSGFIGRETTLGNGILKPVALCGANMAFK